MAETVYTISDYPVYNPDGMTESGGAFTKGLRSHSSCMLGFFIPLSDLPAGYRNATLTVEADVTPINLAIGREFGFWTDAGFFSLTSASRIDLTYTQDGVGYLVPTVRCTNNAIKGQTVQVSSLLLRVTGSGQAPVLLGSEGIKGVRLGETPVIGLRLGDKKLF